MSDLDNQPETDAPATGEVNYLALSDEELLNLPQPGEVPIADEQAETEEVSGDDNQTVNQTGDSATDADGAGSGESDPTTTTDAAADNDAAVEGGEAEADADVSPDYEKLYNELLSPFRANGKEIQIDKVEDARRLMQMGANYNKKMAALKPHLKTLKLLENNGLLDEQKLSFYIDIEQKKPEAIAKLLKDSNIDPLDFDLEKNDYKASTYTVDDREIELDTVLDELKDSSVPATSRNRQYQVGYGK